MKRIEGKPDTLTKHHPVPKIETERFLGSPEKMKDYLFDQYMKQQLLEDFFDELSDYLPFSEVDEMKQAIVECPEADIYAALSLPKELRTLVSFDGSKWS